MNLGGRIELVSMDPRFHDISIALHRQSLNGAPAWYLHTYSSREGSQQRLQDIAGAMVQMAALQADPADPLRLWFSCRSDHQLAVRRAFIETVKVDLSDGLKQPSLSTFDKKSDATITITSLGHGQYRVSADRDSPMAARRAATVAGGLIKLAGMRSVAENSDQVQWDCGHDHDPLVALLLVRALNARGVLREQELATSRGILSAPNQQN